MRPTYHSVSIYDQPFLRYKIVKIGNAPNDPRMALSTQLSNVPVHTEYSPPRPKIHSVSLYGQSFSRYKVVEN